MTEQIINAFLAGKQLRQEALDRQRKQAHEDIDRAAQKELLTEQLRRIKLEDKLKAFDFQHKSAEDQWAAANRTYEADLTPGMMEGGALPVR